MRCAVSFFLNIEKLERHESFLSIAFDWVLVWVVFWGEKLES